MGKMSTYLDLLRCEKAHIVSELWVVSSYIVTFWEDRCYRNGPLISPALFREFMLPRYKRLTSALRDAGIPLMLVDTDGNCSERSTSSSTEISARRSESLGNETTAAPGRSTSIRWLCTAP